MLDKLPLGNYYTK